MAFIGAAAILVVLGGLAPGQERSADDGPMRRSPPAARVDADRLSLAQADAVGPCSAFRAEDGDIPSELPGCAHRRRPVPGSLSDELQFRRGRSETDEAAGEPDPRAGDDPPRRSRQRQSPRRRDLPDSD